LASAYNCSADIFAVGSVENELHAATTATVAISSAQRAPAPTTRCIMLSPPTPIAAIISTAR
jgi:hypothetical protein